jgi:hypothetical protein
MHGAILSLLRDVVRRKRLEKRRTKNWFLLHYNALGHWPFCSRIY